MKRLPIEERFWRFVDRSAGPDACWPWTGHLVAGYGAFSVKSRHVRAHRWLLARTLGRELRPDEQANHRCDNPPCVNPAHLYVGSASDNTADMMARGRGVFRGGQDHGMAKLTWEQVAEIRSIARSGLSQRAIAARFGIGQASIGRILTGKAWRE